MMRAWQKFAVIGGQVNAALYLVMVFVAGLLTGNGAAWRLAIATAGVVYLSYLAHMAWPDTRTDHGLLGGTIVLGAAAGLALLF